MKHWSADANGGFSKALQDALILQVISEGELDLRKGFMRKA